jgi:molecular chaperone DnaK
MLCAVPAPPVLGIDFGTTNTAGAYIDHAGKLQLISCGEGRYSLPSIAWYGSGDRLLVGDSARKMLLDDPKNTVFGSKRFIGKPFQSPFVARHKDRFAFELCAGPDGRTAAVAGGAVRPLEVVATDIIDRLLELAHAKRKIVFNRCVLTVPAHYGLTQREAIRRAAERAGTEVLALVNEPTAAAVYYAKASGDARIVLVFDLGGGTFDATLMTIEHGVVRVLASGGDAFLGGNDFDGAVARALAEVFEREHRIDLTQQPGVMQRLILAAEAAKIQLSTEEPAAVRVPAVTIEGDQFLDLNATLTRRGLEAACAPLIEKALGVCETLLKERDLSPTQIDSLVFVGGMTKMPAIRERMLQRFANGDDGKQPIHPDLGVAVGAAILGHQIEKTGERQLIDVVTVPIGVMVPGAPPMEVIAGSTPVPCSRSAPLVRPPEGQPLSMAVYEALSATSADRELLGTARIGASWLARNRGELFLDMAMGRDFGLRITLRADGGESLRIPLLPPGVSPAS